MPSYFHDPWYFLLLRTLQGGGGGLRKCPYKKKMVMFVIKANNKTCFGEQLKY